MGDSRSSGLKFAADGFETKKLLTADVGEQIARNWTLFPDNGSGHITHPPANRGNQSWMLSQAAKAFHYFEERMVS
jgi:hypothetical protein